MSGWIGMFMNELVRVCVTGCVCACVHEWVGVWVVEWVSEWVRDEGGREGGSGWVSEWVRGWVSEWIKIRFPKWSQNHSKVVFVMIAACARCKTFFAISSVMHRPTSWVITIISLYQFLGCLKSSNEIRNLRSVKCTIGFESKIFWFWVKPLNSLQVIG